MALKLVHDAVDQAQLVLKIRYSIPHFHIFEVIDDYWMD